MTEVNDKLRENGMSELGGEGGGLSKLSTAELAQAYVEGIQAAEATQHVGRKNRLLGRRRHIVQELKARGEARSVLQRLADHSDAEVRKWASGNLAWLDRSGTKTTEETAPPRPLRWQTTWQSDNPPPPVLMRDEIARRLVGALPDFYDRLMDLALPAIGLWPQRRAEVELASSRFGGVPLAPPDWQWPTFEEEPRLFVGQINCAELRGLPGAELLPASGLLAFFGDHDAVMGCFPFDDHCVFHWPDVGRLVPARSEPDPILVFPSCALVPRPMLDLPHPDSRAVGEFNLSEDQRRSYFDVWQEVRDHGIPGDGAYYASFSKLLGWPALVQNEIGMLDSPAAARLLLQVDQYCNGEELHGWGPGGSLYYVLREPDLRAQIFERCELEGQFT
jgi:uncharacterized protein YwqG